MSDNQEKLNEQLFNVIADEKVSDEARLKKLKYLVYLGADVNAKLYGKSVLSKAIEQGAGAQVQNFLREKGANEWVISKEEALEVSQELLDDWGDFKSLDVIKELLKKGADVNQKDESGWPMLMMAIAREYFDVVNCLIDNGVDVNQKDNWGETALMMAVCEGQIDVVKRLVQKGADVNEQDKNGVTALIIGAAKGNMDEVKCLVDGGAQLDIQDKNGWTALITAVFEGQIDVVKYLVEVGADLEVKSENCETAKEFAKNWKKYDCLKFLEEAQKKNSARKNQGDKTGASQIVKKNEGR